MTTFRPKDCAQCGAEYLPTGPCSSYCSRKCKNKARWKIIKDQRAASGRPVGTRGGNYGRTGPDHWAFKHGIDWFKTRLSPIVRDRDKVCQQCSRDCVSEGVGFWCVHHKDHDRTHNDLSNLELLCKRCHQIEHRCWENLPNN